MSPSKNFSELFSSDSTVVDDYYQKFLKDPNSVDESWQSFFYGFNFSRGTSVESGHNDDEKVRKEINVFRLIQSFKQKGHLIADTNPIRKRINRHAHLDLSTFRLDESDLDTVFLAGERIGLGRPATLREIIMYIEQIYTQKIGIEFMHTYDLKVIHWVRDVFEAGMKDFKVSKEKKKRILRKLNQASIFENFLQTKYTGQKRFSLEGGESTIPALDAIIQKGAEMGGTEFVIGMAHRGRLNILANIIGKTYEYIFSEFEGESMEQNEGKGDGDVKYHLGHTTVQKAENGNNIIVKLLSNPSHLEAVNPVVLGYCRAQIDITYESDSSKIVPIVIHGDAALAGQGISYETLQMSNLEGYDVGGTIHFVINNQIGFTTDFVDARSSPYCTSLARTLESPIIHVNGDHPEEVVYACELAMEYRQTFKKDIFIDMVCYRKHGHNEGDEPKYTQPHLYGLISKQKSPREIYLDSLLAKDSISREVAKEMQDEFKSELTDRFNNVKQQEIPKKIKGPHQEWQNLKWSTPADFKKSPETGVSKKVLDSIIDAISTVPDDFNVMKKAGKILASRKTNFDNSQLDWAICEMLAYGSLLVEGNHIRFSGQDVIRGTFSHRHAKVFDELSNEAYCGLSHINDTQGKMYIYNSLLSEYAVLGYEYGYSQGTPHSLNIWEAQFGDFANGAQIMIDQFITSAESKWGRMSGLVMLLPHGYEGQGPEHSSARLERFLQLAAEYNIVIANCSTPANFFHILRRQLAWNFRKPLIVFSPKSLLRDVRCTSSVDDITKGCFKEFFDDNYAVAKKVTRVLLCAGKIYYDLLQKQQEDSRNDIAIVRIEQLYPLPQKELKALHIKYKGAEMVWVQEEPENMGAWAFLLRKRHIIINLNLISRKTSASPATGYNKLHHKELDYLVARAFDPTLPKKQS